MKMKKRKKDPRKQLHKAIMKIIRDAKKRR